MASNGNQGVGGTRNVRQYEADWNKLLDGLEDAGRLTTPRIRSAMEALPRWRFVGSTDPGIRREASRADRPVPTAHGQTISAPHMVAILLEASQPQPGERCLEIGAGSGWLAALLGHLVGPEGHVIAVEIVPELAKRASDHVQQAGLTNVDITQGDGALGDVRAAPYDLIIASCAAPEVPDPLVEQLAQDGRMLVPVGQRTQQHLLRVRRAGDRLRTEDLGGCAFVPLVGEYGF